MEAFSRKSTIKKVDSLIDIKLINFETSEDLARVCEFIKKHTLLKGLDHSKWKDEHDDSIFRYLIDENISLLTCYMVKGCLHVGFQIPDVTTDEIFYFIKKVKDKVTSENMMKNLYYGNVKACYFDSFYRMITEVYVPMFLESENWPECIKWDFTSYLTTFHAELFDFQHRLMGKTVFYIPKHVLKHSVEEIINERELIERLEAIVLLWGYQMKRTLASQDTEGAGGNTGLLEEHAFWEDCCEKLKYIAEQLENPDVKKCIDILVATKSSGLHQFNRLYQEVKDSTLVAEENEKYLSFLKKPCEQFESSSLENVESSLADIHDYIRILWKHSTYFNDSSKAERLLRKTSNMLIKTCCKFISVSDIFDETKESPLDELHKVIDSCDAWKKVCQESEKVHTVFESEKWNVGYSGVFAPVDKFVQRCKNLLLICVCKKEFAETKTDNDQEPFFCLRGMKGRDIGREVLKIEKMFTAALDDLSPFQDTVLDITSKTWDIQFAKFKNTLTHVEEEVVKLLSFAFQELVLVEEGLEIISVFLRFTESSLIEKQLHKYIRCVYDILTKSIEVVKKDVSSRAMFKRHRWPQISGISYWIPFLQRRLDREGKALEAALMWLPQSEHAAEVVANYYSSRESLNEHAYDLFEKWVKDAPKDVDTELHVPLLCDNPREQRLLDVSFNRNIWRYLLELQYWARGNISMPITLSSVNEKRDEYLYLRESLQILAERHNQVLSTLGADEQSLFIKKISVFNKKFMPGLQSIPWTSTKAVEQFLKSCNYQCKTIDKVISNYKNNNQLVVEIIQHISKCYMFNQAVTDITSFEDFERDQKIYIKGMQPTIRELHANLIFAVNNMFTVFSGDGNMVYPPLVKYLQKVDGMLGMALKCNVVDSIKMVFDTVKGKRSKSEKQIMVKLSIVDRKIKADPDMDDMARTVRDLALFMFYCFKGIGKIQDVFISNVKSSKPPFDTQIVQCKMVKNVLRNIGNGFLKYNDALMNYLKQWRPFLYLWEADKDSFFDKYAKSSLSADDFERDIDIYVRATNNIKNIRKYSTVDFCTVDCSSLQQSALEYARDWESTLHSILVKMSSSDLESIYTFISASSARLEEDPSNLDELKESIDNLKSVRNKMKYFEASFSSLHEKFCTLEKNSISVSSHTAATLQLLDNEWNKFKVLVQNTDEMLEDKQETFRKTFLDNGEKLRDQAANLADDFINNGPYSSALTYSEAFDSLKHYMKQLEDLQNEETDLINNLKFFNIDMARSGNLESLQKDLKLMMNAWTLVEKWENLWDEWKVLHIYSLDAKKMQTEVGMLTKRTDNLTNIVQDDRWEMLTSLTKKLSEFMDKIPMVVDLQNRTMVSRHWKAVGEAINRDFFPESENFNLDFLSTVDVEDYPSKIAEISFAATSEHAIGMSIKEIRESWNAVQLEMAEYKNFYKLAEPEDIFQSIEDNQITLGSMKGSKYARPFLEDLDKLECSLSLILEVVELAQSVQKRFLYLEHDLENAGRVNSEMLTIKAIVICTQSFFLKVWGEDIRKQLPRESLEFDDVNTKWQNLTVLMKTEEYVWKASHRPDTLETLANLNSKLEEVQQSLDVYLETKRQSFPRFYFISNDDLLSILGQLNNPVAIQPHLKKCFDSIQELKLGKTEVSQFLSAKGMHSEDGEYVEFSEPVALEGPVEAWLSDVEREMQYTLRGRLLECFIALRKNLTGPDWEKRQNRWLRDWPGQLCLTTRQILWTADCTKALRLVKERDERRPLKKLKRKQVQFINRLSDIIRANLSPMFRKKVMALVTIEVHARDIIEGLIKVRCNDDSAYEWICQLRYYWDREKEDCLIIQTTAEFWYGYEYLGNSPRLVITPLTDRCFLTLTTALRLHQGASPKGPTGTGKTETVKDLGKGLGCYVLVVNCSEGLDYKSLGRMLSGLAQIGAWGSFDEFNRVNVEVLSVVAQQIQCILTALEAEKDRFVFEKQEIILKHSCGIFITMNPGYYAGRVELPYNLTYMFRPMAMIVPDTALIAEILLFAEGFVNTKPLAKKINTMFFLATQQLSKQFHYDFGLRGMVAVLRSAGKKRRMYLDLPDEDVLVLAITDMNMPKLHSSDVPLFHGIIGDLFPNVEVPTFSFTKLVIAVEEKLKDSSLQPTPYTVQKVVQFYESKQSRHSVILVGGTGSGKTTTWQMLQKAFCLLHQQREPNFVSVQVYPLNPKAVSLPEVFGEFDLSTGDWIDGILSSVVRKVCSDTKHEEKWIVFDGPADTQWIESMNSLMDDNKILTLINGERIALSPQVSLVFESEDLSQSSPATVSRSGIVYHEYTSLGWQPYFQSWLKGLKQPTIEEDLQELVNKHLPAILKYKAANCSELVPITELNGVTSMCRLLSALITEVPDSDGQVKVMVKAWFIFSLLWSVCAAVDEEGRRKIDIFVREIEDTFPSKDTVYEYHLDSRTFSWIPWEDSLIDSWKYDPLVPFYKIHVPTVDTLRYAFLISTLLSTMNPVLLVGSVGTGKSLIANHVISNLDDSMYSFVNLNMSAEITSLMVQNVIESCLQKKTRGIYVPPGGKKLIAFMDDFNMPARDRFGAQSPLELIRMWMVYGFWYDRKKREPKHIQDMQLMAAMGPPGGGRNIISAQLQMRFNLINMTFPQESELVRIFGSLIEEKLFEFEDDVKNLAEKITVGTLNVYKNVVSTFLPTPAKMHYLFSLRDIAQVFRGLLLSDKNYIDTYQIMTRFWIHECLRVFSDRLVDKNDKDLFFKIMSDEISTTFNQKMSAICKKDSLPIFAKFISSNDVYEDVKDFSIITNFVTKCMEDYNASSSSDFLNLVLFKEAIEHICRIVRGIEYPGGNMLLIGIGGSGRQSLCLLSSYIANCKLFKIEISKHYGVEDFKDDLKKLLTQAGVKKENVVFLLSDVHFTNEAFLQYVNNILTNGEVPNLFQPDELELVYSELGADDFETDKTKLHSRFIDNVKFNLHVILCMSPAGRKFRQHILNYPALINCMNIDWFGDWPQEALKSVAQRLLRKTDVGEPKEERQDKVAEIFSLIHFSVCASSSKMMEELNRYICITPVNFLRCTKNFDRLLSLKRKEIGNAADKLRAGLKKIDETQEKINVMAAELQEAQVKVADFQKECDEYIVLITNQKKEADAKQEIVAARRIKIAEEKERCERLAAVALKELNEALPALEEAKKALESLNKKDIGEIKSYPKPPVLVETVMEAVMILRESEPTWAEAKRQLGNAFFLRELVEFDKDNISEHALSKIGKYVAMPDFQPDIIGKVSTAARSLCMWVRAMHQYGLIYREVLPKKKRLDAALAELARKQRSLEEAERELRALQEKIEMLKKEYEEKLAIKERLGQEAQLLSLKLDRAANLVKGLASEKERWEHKVSILDARIKFVIGDSLIAASFLSYLGPFVSNYRDQIVHSWRNEIVSADILCSEHFDLADFLIPETTIQQWKVWGLPTDHYSTENGIIINEGGHWPLVIDPQGQAVKWIRNMEGEQGLQITDLQDPGYLRMLENAIRYGTPVLLQNILTELDPALDPLLLKKYIIRGHKAVLNFGGKDIEVNTDFRFYISTKLNNPHFSPELTSKVCVVNFALKEKGLEDQLLGIVVRKERPDLEEQKNKLVLTIALGKQKLQELEDTILRLLYEAQGSLLDDEVLVEALKTSKNTSIEVEEQLSVSQKTEVRIDAAREGYRPCAQRASILFFVLADMSSIDPMYLFSLDAYVDLFISSVEKSSRDPELEERMKKLNEYHTYAVYKYACRAMFEKHKLLLAFHMCTKLLEYAGRMNREEYNFFLRGGVVLDRQSQPVNPCPQWLPDNAWDNITELEKLPRFLDVTLSFEQNSKDWLSWYISTEPEKAHLPGDWKDSCNELQKMLFIRSLRPDRVTNCVTSFVVNNLGSKFVEPPVLNLKNVFDDSLPKTPLIFILSPGVDPSASVASLARTSDTYDKYFTLALGQGQAPVARKLIEDGIKEGNWIFLANCHLLLSWMPELEKIVESFETAAIHKHFRLWLSSVPTPNFPISILQHSIKITTEPPKGLRANMRKLYSVVEEEGRYSFCQNQSKYMKLLFCLCFFHSVLLERAKFQYLGWNVIYNFNESDFKMSNRILGLYLDEYEETPWTALKQLIADINYGGHITDEWDRRLLHTYINQYFCEEALSTPNFPLSSLSTYCIPKDGPFHSYVEYVSVLPVQDRPEVFGQNPNAEISSQIQEASLLFEKLMNLHPVSITSEAETTEQKVLYLINDVLSNIPDFIDENATARILNNEPTPFHVVLVQEVQRYNAHMKIINESLNDLKEAIHGIQLMTPKLEEIFNSISDGHVPALWLKAYPSVMGLGSWTRDLTLRVQQFNTWATTTHPPVKFWLSGFTSPTSFLTAVLQTSARKNNISIDLLSWEFVVSTLEEGHILDAPVEGVFVRGLFLEGAGWDKRNTVLVEPEPLKLVVPMPVIHFKPTSGKKNLRGIYQCPCYYIPRRAEANGTTSYVVTVELKSGKQPPDHWIKRGTALLMSLDH